MTTTPTERRLAITPGEAKHYGNGYVEVRRGERKAIRFNPEGYTPGQPGFVQSVDDATLYADAHNTYNACGLTPSELLAKVREVAGVIARLRHQAELCDFRDSHDHSLMMNAAYLDLITLNLPQ